MTACVNNERKMKGGVLSGKAARVILAGALAVSMAPSVAYAADGDGSGIAPLADIAGWNDTVTVEYTVDEVDGLYVATVDSDIMAVESVTSDIDGVLSPSDYDVVYYKQSKTDKKWYKTDAVKDATINGQAGGAPNTVNPGVETYAIAVIKDGAAEPVVGTVYTPSSDVVWQEFTIKAKTTELKDVVAFEAVDDGKGAIDTSKMADTSFKYSGKNLNVAFKMGGKVVELSKVKMVWSAGSQENGATIDNTLVVKNAGTYTVTLTGNGTDYTGSATVTFTVDAVDLATDEVAIAPVAAGTKLYEGTQDILVNGEALAPGLAAVGKPSIAVSLIGANDGSAAGYNLANLTAAGKYTIKISAAADQSNVKGSTVIDAYVTDEGVVYSYNDNAINGDAPVYADGDLGSFDAAKGSVFTTAAFSAALTGNAGGALANVEPAFTVTVMKDGEAVSDFSEPGHYTGVIETPITTWKGATYAGYATFEFDVAGGADYSDAVAYATVGDKALTADEADSQFAYTGKGIVPKAVAKMDGKVLAEGTDYTVAFEDAEGNAVESAVELGVYTYTLNFNDVNESSVTFKFEIVKAQIKSAEATADFFALPADGSAVVPTFTGYTKVNCEGQAFDLAADQISVKYYKAEWANIAEEGQPAVYGWKHVAAVDADELTEEGNYCADITVLTTAPYIKTAAAVEAHFVLAKRVSFADVAADAWYANVVYKVVSNHYMNGVGDTNLFMPESGITRAELAAVMFNMAGGVGDPDFTPYPTRFSDVDSFGWYAKAVSWASNAGVMNGYTGTDLFGTGDTATREAVACVFYNYAKAQGIDVSVDDAAAALAEFPDGALVSDWAKTAVAWAVENGILGNAGTIDPQATITRAQVAAMAINFQPEPLEDAVIA